MTVMQEYKKIIYSIIFGVIGGIVGVTIFALSGYMISLSFFEPPLFTIILIIVVIKFFGMAKGAFKYLERLYAHEATFEMISRLRFQYFKGSLDKKKETHHIQFIHTLNQSFEAIENYYIKVVYPFIVSVLISFIILFASAALGYEFTIIFSVVIVLILVIIPFVFNYLMKKFLNKKDNVLSASYFALYHYVHDYLNVYTNHQQSKVLNHLYRALSKIEKRDNQVMLTQFFNQYLINIVQLILLISILMLMDVHILIPMIILLAMSYFDIVLPISSDISQFTHLKSKNLNLSHSIETDTARESSSRVPNDITIQNLNYKYNNGLYNVLNDISYTFERGKKYAIIGSSGSGKTTLLKRILNNDANISYDTGYSAFMNHVTVKPQHLDFYNATVRDNLTMFNATTASEEAINVLLKQFNIDHFKIDDNIPFVGHLSKGEENRLHLIRMFLQNHHWWILDEPTAHLNDELKEKVWHELLKKESLIVVTHDLTHIEKFDEVLFMEKGKIVENTNSINILHQTGYIKEMIQRYND